VTKYQETQKNISFHGVWVAGVVGVGVIFLKEVPNTRKRQKTPLVFT
jgi:hypothetical protein